MSKKSAMENVTYINHKGPNNLFNGIVANHDVNGTDLGSVFNIEYEIQKGDVSVKENLPIFVGPNNNPYIQVMDGTNPKLVQIDKIQYREVSVQTVVVNPLTSTPETLVVQKSIVVFKGADGKDYPTSIELSKNGKALMNLQNLAQVAISPIQPAPPAPAIPDIPAPTTRKTLEELKAMATEVTIASNFPNPNNVILVDSTISPNPQIDMLSEKVSSVTYSKIKKTTPRDARYDRFSTANYPDRENIEEIGIEYYLSFKHTKAAAAGGTPTDTTDRIAITIDCYNHVFATLDFGSGEQNYIVEGTGTAKPPVKEGEESFTEDEVVYLDIINDKGQKQRIYLPAEKSKNKEFIENLKKTIEKENQLENIDMVVPPETRKLSDTLMNEVFTEDKTPSGPLSYKKDDTTYFYLPCKNGSTQKYFNFSQKDGDTSLYVNLDKVKNPTPPPDFFADDTTYKVVGYDVDASGAIKLKISNGEKIFSTVTPVMAEEVPDLFNPPTTPTAPYTPKYADPTGIVSGTTFIEVDEKTIPKNKNTEGPSTVEEQDLTSIPEDKKLSTTKSPKGSVLISGNKDFSFEGGSTRNLHSISTIAQDIILNGTRAGAPKSQRIGTFSDEGTSGKKNDVLLMVTSDDNAKYPSGNPPIIIKRDGADGKKTKVFLSEEEATRLGINFSDLKKNRDNYFEFEADAVQLSENMTVGGLTLKARTRSGTNRSFNLTVESQGVALQDIDNSKVYTHTEDTASMDMSVSRQYLNDCLDPTSPRQFKGVFKAPPAAPGSLLDFDKLPESFKQMFVMQTRLYRMQQENLRNSTPADLVNGDPNKALSIGEPPKYELYSIPTIDDNGNVTYSDFVKDLTATPAKTYFYGHTSNEEQKNRTKPRYHEVKQGYLAVEGTSKKSYKYHVVIEEPHKKGETNKGVEMPVDPSQNKDMFNFVKSNLADPQDVASSEGRAKPARKRGGTNYNDDSGTQNIHTYAYDPLGKAKIIDDNVATMQKEVKEITPDAIPDIKFPEPDRKVGPTVDDIVEQEAPKKDWTQLWTGIKDENKKTWVAAFAIITLLSIFLPFLALISGPLLGIMVASDTGLFTDVWLRPTNYRHSRWAKHKKEIDGKGLQIEKQIAKNQDRIMDIDITLDNIKDEINKIKSDPKLTEAQKQAKIKKLEKEKAYYETEKSNLAKNNAELAVELAVHTDKKLIMLKEERDRLSEIKKKLEPIMSRRALTREKVSIDEIKDFRDPGTLSTRNMERNAQLTTINLLLTDKNFKDDLIGKNKILLEQQKVYLEMEKSYENAIPPATPNPLSKEDEKLAKKHGLDQKEYNETRELMEKQNNGTISPDELRRLEELKRLYGWSPFASLFGLWESIDNETSSTEQIVRARGERFAAEHPDKNGMVDYEIRPEEKAAGETKTGDTSKYNYSDPTQPKRKMDDEGMIF